MALNRADYLLQLQALLPSGRAWSRAIGSVLSKLLSAFSEEFARIDKRVDELVNEADPRTTSELLADWERMAGLPDPCVTDDQTVDQRRAALVGKLTLLGGQSRAYYISIAESLGYENTTITEFRPMNCNDDCNDALNSEADRFAWQVNLEQQGGTFIFNAESACDSPLVAWGDEAVECRISRYKPAHTDVIFAYN